MRAGMMWRRRARVLPALLLALAAIHHAGASSAPGADGEGYPHAHLLVDAAAGATPEKEIVTYCQTHSRASHTYFTLRLMGYPRVKAYLGSWEEWGNDPALSVE